MAAAEVVVVAAEEVQRHPAPIAVVVVVAAAAVVSVWERRPSHERLWEGPDDHACCGVYICIYMCVCERETGKKQPRKRVAWEE